MESGFVALTGIVALRARRRRARACRLALSVATALAVAMALAIATALASCSVDYSEAIFDESLSDLVPDTVIHAFEHNVVRDGKLVFRLQAREARVFERSRKTYLSGVSFEEYDMSSGKVVTKGKAEKADLDNATNDIEISGGIAFESARDDIALETEYLRWIDSEKRLVGRDDIVTTVRRSNGTVLRGAGFSAEARDRSVTFTERVDGVIVVEDVAEEEAE